MDAEPVHLSLRTLIPLAAGARRRCRPTPPAESERLYILITPAYYFSLVRQVPVVYLPNDGQRDGEGGLGRVVLGRALVLEDRVREVQE
jgi:hypothetical protein